MRKSKTTKQHEEDRRMILRVLLEWEFYPRSPEQIQRDLDRLLCPVSIEGVYFHLHYMAAKDKGWLEIEEKPVSGEHPDILWAKITPAGVDELDHWDERHRELEIRK
jgi:DNA-binding PadR family transcriptional regulator